MNPLLDRLHLSVNRMTETARVVDGSTRMGGAGRRRRDDRGRDLADGARALMLYLDLGETPRRSRATGSQEDPLGAWRLLYGCLHQALMDLVTEPDPSPPCPECMPDGTLRAASYAYRRAITAGLLAAPAGYECLTGWWFSDVVDVAHDGVTLQAISEFFFTPIEDLRAVALRAADLRTWLLLKHANLAAPLPALVAA